MNLIDPPKEDLNAPKGLRPFGALSEGVRSTEGGPPLGAPYASGGERPEEEATEEPTTRDLGDPVVRRGTSSPKGLRPLGSAVRPIRSVRKERRASSSYGARRA